MRIPGKFIILISTVLLTFVHAYATLPPSDPIIWFNIEYLDDCDPRIHKDCTVKLTTMVMPVQHDDLYKEGPHRRPDDKIVYIFHYPYGTQWSIDMTTAVEIQMHALLQHNPNASLQYKKCHGVFDDGTCNDTTDALPDYAESDPGMPIRPFMWIQPITCDADADVATMDTSAVHHYQILYTFVGKVNAVETLPDKVQAKITISNLDR